MCGIVGIFNRGPVANDESTQRLISEMTDCLVHRGPDDAGIWFDSHAGLALGFRRLAIIDLSPAGHQPMSSADGRYVIAMNGEIYNFRQIRADIDALCPMLHWRGHCDAEVLVEAIALWGVERVLPRLNGMFAFAVWDRKDHTLWLARDRVGKKPLYYGWAGDGLVFGSELKALWHHPLFNSEVSPKALGTFLQLGYTLGQQSIFAATSKLPAGHFLRIEQRDIARHDIPAPTAYWSLRDVALAGLDAQASGQFADLDELETIVRDAVSCRMVADVPVGVFLSGGIDSSLVAAEMAACASGAVQSFAIGFTVPQWNEAQHAQAVANQLGTRHQELYVGKAEILDLVDRIPEICDEPFADDSIIPTALLCRLARQNVTVALSGDGGDELFAGYQRYIAASRWLARRAVVPKMGRTIIGSFIEGIAFPVARQWGSRKLERRLGLLNCLLRSDNAESFHNGIMSQSLNAGSLSTAREMRADALLDPTFSLGRSGPIDRMTFIDGMSFLVDDILMKVDRASMAVSLEVRCPLLDHRVIELAWRFSAEMKCQGGTGKMPLRSVLYRHVPRSIVDRPKMGFSAPVEVWVRRELQDWAEALMTRDALGEHGLLDVRACRQLWNDFVQRGRGWDRAIWNILMFQAWYTAMKRIGCADTPLQRSNASRALYAA